MHALMLMRWVALWAACGARESVTSRLEGEALESTQVGVGVQHARVPRAVGSAGPTVLTAADALFFDSMPRMLQRSRHPRREPDGWRLETGSRGLSLRTTPSGVTITSPGGARMDLETRVNGVASSWGPFDVRPCEGVRDLPCDLRLARTDAVSGVEEWWIAEAEGLHHGFILWRAGQYRIELKHDGWRSEPAGAGAVTWESAVGERWDYRGARAWNSSGAERRLRFGIGNSETIIDAFFLNEDKYVVIDPEIVDPDWVGNGTTSYDEFGLTATAGDFDTAPPAHADAIR